MRRTRDPLTELLALRLAAGVEFAAPLAKALLAAGRAEAELVPPEWRPTARHRALAQRQVVALRAIGIQVVPAWQLPSSFRRLAWPPSVLFLRGNRRALQRRGVALVGSRQACPSATRWAWERARALAELGVPVIPGGARGVDAAAHRGALRGGAGTVAYLGVAADRIYPPGNWQLFAAILAGGGALVSEHAPGEMTFKSGHALRNRFIAAQSAAVIVVEARQRSGTLGTVRYARALGLPVWTSPPGIGQMRAGITDLLDKGMARILPRDAEVEDPGAGV